MRRILNLICLSFVMLLFGCNSTINDSDIKDSGDLIINGVLIDIKEINALITSSTPTITLSEQDELFSYECALELNGTEIKIILEYSLDGNLKNMRVSNNDINAENAPNVVKLIDTTVSSLAQELDATEKFMVQLETDLLNLEPSKLLSKEIDGYTMSLLYYSPSYIVGNGLNSMVQSLYKTYSMTDETFIKAYDSAEQKFKGSYSVTLIDKK